MCSSPSIRYALCLYFDDNYIDQYLNGDLHNSVTSVSVGQIRLFQLDHQISR